LTRGLSWTDCPTCKQDYTGEVPLSLARGRWELKRGRPEEDNERLAAMNGLGLALKASGDDPAHNRRTLGEDHPTTQRSVKSLLIMEAALAEPEPSPPCARPGCPKCAAAGECPRCGVLYCTNKCMKADRKPHKKKCGK